MQRTRTKKEFPKQLVQDLLRFRENTGMTLNRIINQAIKDLPETEETLEALRKDSFNAYYESECIEKVQRLVVASKVKKGSRTLGGNDTTVIHYALKKFLENNKDHQALQKED